MLHSEDTWYKPYNKDVWGTIVLGYSLHDF